MSDTLCPSSPRRSPAAREPFGVDASSPPQSITQIHACPAAISFKRPRVQFIPDAKTVVLGQLSSDDRLVGRSLGQL